MNAINPTVTVDLLVQVHGSEQAALQIASIAVEGELHPHGGFPLPGATHIELVGKFKSIDLAGVFRAVAAELEGNAEVNPIPTTEEIRELYVAHRRAEGSLFRSADFEFDIWLGTIDRREATILELQHPGNCENCGHRSDCSLHNRPALPVGPCDCGATNG